MKKQELNNWYSALSRHKAIVAIVLIFLVLKLMLPFLMEDDANVYWYMGKLVSEGVVPYRDFRVVHPPLMLFLSALFFRIFGAGLMVGRMVPALSGVGILIFTYLLGNKAKEGMGTLAAVFLFFSPHFQTLTNSMLGASLNLVFLLASFYFLTEKRDAVAGVCFVLAGLARFSSFPFFILMLLYVAWKKRWRFFYGVGALAPVLVALAMAPNFLEYSVFSVFTRNVLQSLKMAGFYIFLIVNRGVIAMGAIGAYLVTLAKKKSEMLQFAVVACASILLSLFLSEIRYWYIYYSLPFFCILGAYFVRHVQGLVPKKARLGLVLLVGLILFWGFAPVLDYSDSKMVEDVLAPAVRPGMVIYDLSGTKAAYMGLKYGTRLPVELVDNNAIALASGDVEPAYVVHVLGQEKPSYIIDYRQDERTTYWMTTEIKDFIGDNYKPALQATEDETGNMLAIWERK